MAITPYSTMINAVHGQQRLDPVPNGMESPIVQLLRRMREFEPDLRGRPRSVSPAHPTKKVALSRALKPKGLKPFKGFK